MSKIHKTASDWRRGSKRRMIADIAERGTTKRQAFAELRPLVENQIKPMVFSANVGGSRTPKTLGEQLIELKFEIGRVYAILGRAKTSDFESEETTPEPEETQTPEETPEDEEETPEDEISEEETPEKPVAKGKEKIKSELDYFLRRVREIRAFCKRREALSEKLDSISVRWAEAASKLIPAGIPADALLHAGAMHWPEDARRDAGIADFDFISLSREIMEDRGIEGNYHCLFGYALVLAECRQPIMLIGPAGTGKSHLAEQLSEYLTETTDTVYPYGETPMSPGATRGDLLGRHTIGGFIPSEFTAMYSGGGIFNFEEIDASDPSMLIVLNNALARKTLYNSANGEKYARHENTVPVSTANTFGLGANREFTGREKLDAATLDRWRMGRIFVDLDESIEEAILYSRVGQ